jgi:predicted nucleic acid-binding protein
MKGAVVDASVAAKWVIDEPGADATSRLASLQLTAPTLLLAECANAFWAKTPRSELTPDEARERIEALQASPLTLVPLTNLVSDAVKLALELRHPVYDCCYLALAIQRSLLLITADQQFSGAVRAHTAHAERIVALAEQP